MKNLFSISVMGLALAAAAVPASAELSWQTQPILGTYATNVTGDVVVITGPTPKTPGGDYYYDVDGNVVLGPTIPHYNLPGDPLYGVGSPSMTTFVIHPTAWDGTHWYDPDSNVATGSGIYVDRGHTYRWTQTFTYLGSLQPSYTLSWGNDYSAPADGDGFVMLMAPSALYDFWAEDVGLWKYTETWTDKATGASISATRDFQVAVPAPGAALLVGLGLGLIGWFKRRMA